MTLYEGRATSVLWPTNEPNMDARRSLANDDAEGARVTAGVAVNYNAKMVGELGLKLLEITLFVVKWGDVRHI